MKIKLERTGEGEGDELLGHKAIEFDSDDLALVPRANAAGRDVLVAVVPCICIKANGETARTWAAMSDIEHDIEAGWLRITE